jgi:hypothetical protein
MSLSTVVQKILQSSKDIEPLLRDALRSTEGVSRLLQSDSISHLLQLDTISQINKLTNLYDILGETLQQYLEQTSHTEESI